MISVCLFTLLSVLCPFLCFPFCVTHNYHLLQTSNQTAVLCFLYACVIIVIKENYILALEWNIGAVTFSALFLSISTIFFWSVDPKFRNR